MLIDSATGGLIGGLVGVSVCAVIGILALGFWIWRLRKYIKVHDRRVNGFTDQTSIEQENYEADQTYRLQDRSRMVDEIGGRLGEN
jgi:hypothetical protein